MYHASTLSPHIDPAHAADTPADRSNALAVIAHLVSSPRTSSLIRGSSLLHTGLSELRERVRSDIRNGHTPADPRFGIEPPHTPIVPVAIRHMLEGADIAFGLEYPLQLRHPANVDLSTIDSDFMYENIVGRTANPAKKWASREHDAFTKSLAAYLSIESSGGIRYWFDGNNWLVAKNFHPHRWDDYSRRNAVGRVYFSLDPHKVNRYWNEMTSVAAATSAPLLWKINVHPEAYHRGDVGVLYFLSPDSASVYDMTRHIYAGHGAWFMDATPLFAARLHDSASGLPMQGISFAESPPWDDISLNEMISRVLGAARKGLRLRMLLGEEPTPEDIVQAAAYAFRFYGISLDHPAVSDENLGAFREILVHTDQKP